MSENLDLPTNGCAAWSEPQTKLARLRDCLKAELVAEKIPGCVFDESMGKHIVHTVEWLIDKLVDAQVELRVADEALKLLADCVVKNQPLGLFMADESATEIVRLWKNHAELVVKGK
jgi:hypothetical protein